MEDTKVDEMYMENLEEWIFEEEKIVTYKFLSRSLKIHVNVAKQMLFNFVEKNKTKHPDIGVVYLVSGLVPSNKDDDASDPFDQKVMCVKQENLEQTLKGFKTILSQHIYSVQQNNNTVSATSLFCADQIKNSHDISVASIAGFNAIKHKNAVPREAVRVPTVIKKEIKTEPVVKKEPSKKTSGIQDAFSKVTKKSPEKNQQKQTKSAGSTSAGGTKGKGASGIAGMFARQATTKPKPKSTEEKENIVNQKIEADTSSGSKDSSPEKTEIVKSNPKTSGSKKAKTSGKKSAKVDDGKKRKRIQVISDSEEEEDDDKVEEREETATEVEEAPPVSKLIESDEEMEEIAATPVQESKTRVGRKRVKKLVDKTYMDDAGYMVTKKVYVSGSESDEEPELKKPIKKVEKVQIRFSFPLIYQSFKFQVEQPVAKKPKLTGSGTKGQTGIMNFFKKK